MVLCILDNRSLLYFSRALSHGCRRKALAVDVCPKIYISPQVGLPYIEESLRLVMAHMSSADASMGKAALDKCVENV
jgi:hypothetical protein